MWIQDILISALRRAGREDIAEYIESGFDPYGEYADVIQIMMYCINAVEDELARYYFPLTYTETLRATEGNIFKFSDFSRTPVKILKVKHGGREIKYELQPNYIVAERGEIEVTYCYTPKKKLQDGQSEFGAISDGSITALGAAAEYCLICGEISMAEMLETRYHEAIDRVQRKKNSEVYVPPRRWI